MTFLQSFGIGVGIGVVHSAIMCVVLLLARRNARHREDEAIALMRERNDLDRQKVEALRALKKPPVAGYTDIIPGPTVDE